MSRLHERIISELVKYIWIPVLIGVAIASFKSLDWKIGLGIIVALTPAYVFGALYYNERKKAKILTVVRQPQEPDDYITDIQLRADEDIIDHANRYKLIRFEALVDKQGNYHAKYRMTGINVSNDYIQYITVKTATDSNAAYKETKMSAKDLKTGAKLKIVPFSDVRFQKKCKIWFTSPISTGKDFDIEWSFFWPRVMRKPADFDGFNISRFAKGIDRLELELIFEWSLYLVALWEVHGNQQVMSRRQPDCSNDHIGRNHYIWWFENPRDNKIDSIIFSYMS